MKEIKRADVYIVSLDPVKGSEQGGTRPCVVLQNDIGNRYSPTVIVAPITSRLKKRDMPTHVMLPEGNGFPTRSMVCLEHLRTIDCKRLTKFVTSLDGETMAKVDIALAVSIGLAQLKYDEVELCLCSACVKQFFSTAQFIVKRVDQSSKKKDQCCYCNDRGGFDYKIINKQRRVLSSLQNGKKV